MYSMRDRSERKQYFLIHTTMVLLVLFFILGVPFFRSGFFSSGRGETDTVSGASVIYDTPSGEYVVLINRPLHEESGTLETWETFFSGGEIGVVFEDLHCLTIRGDAAGIDAAISFQSRLPENQMRVRTEEGVLIASKETFGLYDIIVMSSEAYEGFGMSGHTNGEMTTVVTVSGP